MTQDLEQLARGVYDDLADDSITFKEFLALSNDLGAAYVVTPWVLSARGFERSINTANREYTVALEIFPIDKVTVDFWAQRAEQPGYAEAIAKVYHPLKARYPHLSRRGNGLGYAMDGQHLIKAMRIVGETEVLAAVVYGLTRLEEAALFVALNTVRVVKALDKFRINANAGVEPYASINKALADCGWKASSAGQIGQLACVDTLVRAAAGKGGMDVVVRVLDTITRAWGHDPAAVYAPLVSGMIKVHTRFPDQVDSNHMVSSMEKLNATPLQIRKLAQDALDQTPGKAVLHARYILTRYNAGQRKDKRLLAFGAS